MADTALGSPPRQRASASGGWLASIWAGVWPVLLVVALLLGIWTAACVPMNMAAALTNAERAGAVVDPPTAAERREMSGMALFLKNPTYAAQSFGQERPRLPSPMQVGEELWNTTGAMVLKGRTWSKRSLFFHGWITLSAALLGFGLGTALGVALAIGIVHSRAMDLSVMPWAIASQTIPILAVAPMIIVVLASVGLTGLMPKALISTYLSFFPVVVGMVAGLRSPDRSQTDLLHTYNATQAQVLWSLRFPASMPYLFTSLKIGMAAALVGAIVGELPTGAVRGLGARLLAGSYYGQTTQIWAALFASAILAAVMVGLISLIQRVTLKRMGMAT